MDPINEILDACGFQGSWAPLETTGLANRIYATKDVVIRVSREHDEALRDARTESIAAPIAYEAGLKTPRFLVFDESGELAEGPYSIWERVHGETLGLISSDSLSMPNTWHAVGQQMGQLHTHVEPFDDPKNYLHEPAREPDLLSILEKLASRGALDKNLEKEISTLIAELRPAVLEETKVCFLHSDIKDMNIMCTHDDDFLALIDWGDAGWGDPTFDFRQLPLLAIENVLEGYREMAPDILGEMLKERLIWDKLYEAMLEALKNPAYKIPVGTFREFLDTDLVRFL